MLENIENKIGTVSEIYKGEELVWDKLYCDWVQPKINSSSQLIEIMVFPKKGTRVELQLTELDYSTFKNKVIYSDTKESNDSGYVRFNEFPYLKKNSLVNFIISNPRCKTIKKNVVVE